MYGLAPRVGYRSSDGANARRLEGVLSTNHVLGVIAEITAAVEEVLARHGYGGKMETKFSRWVKAQKVASVAEELRARGHKRTEQCIYRWIATDEKVTQPLPDVARVLVEISAGALTLADVYAHKPAVLASVVASTAPMAQLAGAGQDAR